MSARDLLELVRRWLRTRPGRLVLAGGLCGATMLVATTALAQQPAPTPMTVESVAPPPAASPAPAAPAEHAAPAATPVAVDPHGTAPAAPATTPGPDPHAAPAAPHGAAPADPHAAHGAPDHPAGAHPAHDDPSKPGEGHHGGHEGGFHAPAPFNFADTARYTEEKERAARGEKITPVTPYAYLLINAAILFFIYYRAGRKPVTEGLAARHDAIAKELGEAARIKADAQARLEEYEKRLADLDVELERIKAEIIKTGEADRERIVKEAETKAERMRKDTQFLLDQEMKQLRNDMLAFTAEAAVTAAEQVLKSQVGPQDHDRLADDYLKQISAPGGAS